MTALRTPQPALPQMVSQTLTHLRDGYDFLGGEIDDAISLLDAGEFERARAVLVDALREMDRELARH
jgi:soluble cytochrome b562